MINNVLNDNNYTGKEILMTESYQPENLGATKKVYVKRKYDVARDSVDKTHAIEKKHTRFDVEK